MEPDDEWYDEMYEMALSLAEEMGIEDVEVVIVEPSPEPLIRYADTEAWWLLPPE